MKRLALILTLCLCLSVPCSALTFFQADYDADEWTTETVYEGDWLPLRELSSILPYTVEWKDRTIYIYANRTWTIKPDWWLPPDVKIVDGVTYVTPKYLDGILGGRAFRYDGELYVYHGESTSSKLVRGSETFRANVLTTMYRLKMVLPEDYKLIRRHLNGGIEEMTFRNGLPYGTAAYIYPAASKPTAYIVAAGLTGGNLAELIAHEAYHVYLYRQGKQNESEATEYGQQIKYVLWASPN